jgi:DNA mismatch repair protein MutS
VIRQARKVLEMLEQQSLERGGQNDLFANPTGTEKAPPEADALREALQAVNPDELTPREALEFLYRLKKL